MKTKMNLNFFDIFGRYVCDPDDNGHRQVYWWFDWRSFSIFLLCGVTPTLCILSYILGYTTLDNEYKKLVDKHNRYVELSQRESVAWKPEDDIPCKPGYHVEIHDTYERDDYYKLMQYGSQLRCGVVTNYIKDEIKVSEQEARLKK